MRNKIYCGDALKVLKTFPSNSVDCCVTSPPYWGLRDYGVNGQLGLEKTPEEYVKKMVEIFVEVKRVLKKEGTLWLNLGDSYKPVNYGPNAKLRKESTGVKGTLQEKVGHWHSDLGGKDSHERHKACSKMGLKTKDLCGIPWRVAFALQSDGWYLRSDIIWSKPNPMPESVTDRPTKAHEYIFLMAKSQKYYYDADAVKEKLKDSSIKRNQTGWDGNEDRDYINGPQNHMSKYLGSNKAKEETHRNKRSVWEIATQPYSKAHFATFPPKLIKPCILAGCPEGGLILDPFIGSGTTAITARKLARNYVGIELNPEYIPMIEKRLEQGYLF